MRFMSNVLKKVYPKAVVALSSGADSIAILHFLKTKYPKLNLSAIHYNHNLRSQNFDMQKNAEIFCSDYNIPLTVNVREASEKEISYSEAELRLLRYQSFKGQGNVITGHHLDDAVESYLMNCFNGTPEYLPIPNETEYKLLGFCVFRPFLISTKEQILKYISNHNLEKYVIEDETNVELKYRRNWIRHKIIPEVKQFYNLQTIVKKKYLKK